MQLARDLANRIRPLATRIRSWRPRSTPMQTWVADHVVDAPGSRVAVRYAWAAWARHAEAIGVDQGTRDELVRVIRSRWPEARKVKGKSGQGDPRWWYLTGIKIK